MFASLVRQYLGSNLVNLLSPHYLLGHLLDHQDTREVPHTLDVPPTCNGHDCSWGVPRYCDGDPPLGSAEVDMHAV